MDQSNEAALAEKRYARFWRILRPIVVVVLRLLFSYTAEPAGSFDGPTIVMSNHTTGMDQIYIGCSFKKPLYYVGGEHLYRMGGPLRWFLDRYRPVIPRVKGSTDASAAAGMLRAIKSGRQVCIYPEGNMTFTGVTLPLHPTTARLVKAAKGARLITYRVTGGYLADPRWALKRRRGRQHGAVCRVYSPEEIASMSTAELARNIREDLRVDAYEEQRRSGHRYTGTRLAEQLETALYICPKCGGTGTLKSSGNRFSCSCGLDLTVDSLGRFSGPGAPFPDLLSWDAWQEEEVSRMASAAGDGPVFSDPGQTLWESFPDHSSARVCSGELSLGPAGLSIGELSFPLREITGVDLVLKDRLFFSSGGKNYYVTSDRLRSGRKYVTLFGYLRDNARKEAAEKKREL